MRFYILAHDASANALGRALSNGLVAATLGPTKVVALEGASGKRWGGAAQFPLSVDVLPRSSASWNGVQLARALQWHGEPAALWVSKGFSPLDTWVGRLVEVFPSGVVILDLDDDDAGLAAAFRARSWKNASKLHRFRRGHPKQIMKSQKAVASLAQGVTFATDAIKDRYEDFALPSARIPHVRLDDEERARAVWCLDKIRVGTFGRIRFHKGGDLLRSLIDRYPNVELWTFENSGMGPANMPNWVEIGPSTPLSVAYSNIDVALIPITNADPAAQAQLPAKLVDAMRCGIPIVATPTPAINEIAAGCFIPLTPDEDLEGVYRKIELAAASGIGERARQRYLEELTPSRVAVHLSGLLDRIGEYSGQP